MYILVGAWVAYASNEMETVRRLLHDHSPPLLLSLLLGWCIIAVMLRMIANSYDFLRKGGEGARAKAEGGGKSKQMVKHWLWPHLQGDLCTQRTDVCVGALHSNRIIGPYFCLSVSLSHPNRVPLPGHEGGGEWGREVNQGSWMYGRQTSLPSRAPVSSMRLRPLGGMGLMLSFCVYICVCVMFILS